MNEAQPSNDELIAAVDGSVYPLSNAECVFRVKASGEKHVMTMQVLQALDLCSQFRSFEEHVQAVMRALPDLKGREADVRRVLEALDKRGLFVTARQVLAQADQAPSEANNGLGGVFIRSNGRSKSLTTLLQSLAANERAFGNRYRYFVLDDAHDEQAEACRAAVAAIKAAGLDCHWLGRDWQQAFCRRLMEDAGVEPRIVKGALLHDGAASGFTGGRLRNVIALASAGKAHLLLDDDLVCRARMHEDPRGLMLDEGEWALWFHPDAAAAERWGEPADFDPLARHATLLGLPVGAALNQLQTGVQALAGLDQRKLSRVLDAPVLSTLSGTYGDAASTTQLWFYTATGASRERFYASREAYDRNRSSRFVTRAQDALALQPISQFTPVGLAGQYLLPPTLPAGRNEDSLFAVTQHCLYPQSRSMEFPWALGHYPEEARQWDAAPWAQPCGDNLARFIGACLLGSGTPTPGGEAVHRFALLADQLHLIAGGGDAQLLARLDEFVLFVRSDLIAQLQTHLKAAGQAPVYWGADVRRIIEVNAKALGQSEPARLQDMPEGLDEAGAAQWLRQGMEGFAETLRVWPELWQTARGVDALPE